MFVNHLNPKQLLGLIRLSHISTVDKHIVSSYEIAKDMFFLVR